MKKLSILAVGVVLAAMCLTVQGQVWEEWAETYNYDATTGQRPNNDVAQAFDIVVDDNGNSYVTGRSAHGALTSDYDYTTIKYNNHGVTQWIARYNGQVDGEDCPTAIALDTEGNIIVTGYSNVPGQENEICTIKYSQSGNEIWVAHFNSIAFPADVPNALAIDSQGNIFITGRSVQNGNNYHLVLLKYNSLGVLQWDIISNDPWRSEGMDLVADHLGNVYVTGEIQTSSYWDDTECITVKYDNLGNLVWCDRFSQSAYHENLGEYINLNGGDIYVAGTTNLDGWNDYDLLLLKYNSVGERQWTQHFGTTEDYSNSAQGLAVSPQGEVYAIIDCYMAYGDNRSRAIVKYNSQGTLEWFNFTYEPPISSYPIDITIDGSSNAYVTGWTAGGGNMESAFTERYNPEGFREWFLVHIVQDSDCSCDAVAVDSAQNVYVTGSANIGSSYHPEYAFLTIKYVQTNSLTLSPSQNYTFFLLDTSPNPFNPSTVASYELRVASHVSLRVYDTAGRLVVTLADGWQEAGTHSATFDGSKLAAGVYIARLTAGEFTAAQKLVLLK